MYNFFLKKVINHKKNLKLSKGFSLFELLLVIGILIAISLGGVGFYMNYGKNVEVNSFMKTLSSDIKLAQEESMVGYGSLKYGVHFVNGTKDYYEIFSTATDYNAGTVISTNYLPNGISFSDPALNASKDIIFDKISGKATPFSVSTVSSSGDIAQIINISSVGAVSVVQSQIAQQCSSSITATATVNPICPGSSTMIYATGGTDYVWDNSLGAGVSKTVSPLVDTTYNVTAATVNSCTPSASVTVNGATSYLWDTNASTPSVTVSPTTSTIYHVIGSTDGCSSADTTKSINVYSASAGGNKFICSGGSVALNATSIGFSSPIYSWNPGNLTGSSINVSPITNTTYSMIATDSSNTFQSTPHNVTVTVNSNPIVNAGTDKTTTLGGTVQLSGSVTSGTGPYSYSWSTSDGTIISGANTLTPTVSAGHYTLSISDAFSCSSSDDVVVSVLLGSYIFSGNISYAFNATNNQMHDVTIQLVDINSGAQYSGTTPSTGNGDFSISVPAGTYKVYLSSSKPWGGVTATDINLIQNHYKVPPTLLQGIKRLTADVVDNSSSAIVIANDRDLINTKRITPTTIFPTGNWVFTKAEDISSTTYPISYANVAGYSDITVTIAGNTTQNFKSLCYGDVDASNTGLK